MAETRTDPVPADVPLFLRRNGFAPPAELLTGDRVRRVPWLTGGSAWLVTRQADVKAVLADPARFSNVPPEPGAVGGEVAGNLLLMDPPDHHRLRRMLTGQFTHRRMRHLAPLVERVVEEHLDAMERSGPGADLVADFALPVPSLVICELLGVPWEDRAEFKERSATMLDLSLPESARDQAQREIHEYLAGLVGRIGEEPGDDLLGMLVRDHGDELTTAELAGLGFLLLVAGHETTANMLALGTLVLLGHPDQLAAVRDDPEAVEPAVEELMRWLSIVPSGVQRYATADVGVAGETIRAGDVVIVGLHTANRDPDFVTDPATLDISRGEVGHLGFGHGVHHCLGAPLARLEMRIAFPALFRRFPALALAVPENEVEFRALSAVYGVTALPVTW
ncbi:cytochrome P450 [Lentzea cavernae]|uniref:Cytochrome P450 n=1 Tax=Lentzea cavernae TaxID=2020703 RepID=A0ABQ3M3V8_9PSEU|nr:cytochrome P450 [Lentzea cavernae]GHH30779.1 cytochrome P450 [Lentzea cavernae]